MTKHRKTHHYGPDARTALCGARDEYATCYAREVNCHACRQRMARATSGEQP